MASDREMLEGGGALVLLGKRKTPPARNPQGEEEEEEEEEAATAAEEEEEREIEELEREIAELGRRILDSRRTLPERLLQALTARLVALRPPPPPPRRGALVDAADNTITTPAGMQLPPSDLSNKGLMAEADRASLEKLQACRAKIASNITSMPEVLKRTNECIAKIEELEQHNLVIHPVFKRTR